MILNLLQGQAAIPTKSQNAVLIELYCYIKKQPSKAEGCFFISLQPIPRQRRALHLGESRRRHRVRHIQARAG